MDSVPRLSFPDVVSILTQTHACNRCETWNSRLHRMDMQQKRIDMINTVREEMRDQVRLMISSVENVMLVAVLLLTFAYGFACEGTFPHAEAAGADYPGIQQLALDAYAWLLGLSLAFPGLALVLALAVRIEAEICFEDVSCDLSAHIREAIDRVRQGAEYSLLTTAFANPSDGEPGADAPSCDRDTEPFALELQELESDARLVADLAHGLIQRVQYFHYLYPIAQLLIFFGLICSVLLCSCMSGIIFCHHYPNSPWVWRIYSGTVAGSAFGCAVFALFMRSVLLHPSSGALVEGSDMAPSPPQQPLARGLRRLGRMW
eukprot:CAMPEP_0170221798 /NCGR_PEP_ID=MMETSP0116_2-20130129/10588_1 /TAXON_ID=400756 /ORGANISM="Durinskia baltica, Strain CSIRO CS-38" /LENGTH=317 /DNA_ID=CAMNT_0010472479 /DNA_START=119 /DNA_END=1069 /DNA_ORIENTATION=+